MYTWIYTYLDISMNILHKIHIKHIKIVWIEYELQKKWTTIYYRKKLWIYQWKYQEITKGDYTFYFIFL